MDVTYRTLGPWGPGKGANLQPSEVDSNFWSIAQTILDLQENPSLPNGIASITVSGTQMTIYLNDGSVMGPFTLPVLTFRWRGEWEPSTSYTALDVFTVFDTGIFMVLVSHISDVSFDAALLVGGAAAYQQLFGSTDAKLSGLSDVHITSLQIGDVLNWNGAGWSNVLLGSLAYYNVYDVVITGGSITGMPPPVNPSDVATKAYVDSLPTGATAPIGTMMSNISTIVAPAVPNTFSNYLDSVLGTSIRGTLLYRGGSGWIALPPGIPSYFLQTMGPGLDPTWALGISGVTSITGGTGITTTPGAISSTGSIALAAVSDNQILANVSGTTVAPAPVTLGQLLDHILGTARGTVITRTIGGWLTLAPGLNGQYLKTQGTGADLVWDSPPGAGTVTSISAGTGISTGGSPITGAGTVALAAIATASLLGNITGSAAAPVPITASLFFDSVFTSTQGAVLYRSGATWVALTPGTSGQILTTGGPTANPSWQNAPVTGASVTNNRIVSNISGSTAVPVGNTLTNILDAIIGSARGTIIYRTNSGWTGLAPGTSGQVLQTAGGAGDPSWATNGGGSILIAAPAAEDTLSYNTSSGKFENVRPRYNLGAYVPGLMVANQNLLYHKVSKALTLPANLGAYRGHSSTAGGSVSATASTAITLARATAGAPTSFSTVATITFGAGTVTGSMSTQAAISFAQGDVLRIRGPASPDASLSDVHITLAGYET